MRKEVEDRLPGTECDHGAAHEVDRDHSERELDQAAPGPLTQRQISPGAIVLGFIESANPIETTIPNRRSTVLFLAHLGLPVGQRQI